MATSIFFELERAVRGDTINIKDFLVENVEIIDGVEVRTPVDLTGFEITMDLVLGNERIRKTLGNGFTMSPENAIAGIFYMDAFKLNTAGTWKWDQEWKLPDQRDKTYLSGTIYVEDDITKTEII